MFYLFSFPHRTFRGKAMANYPQELAQDRMPEPYRSHDWDLVPAKPGLQG